MSTAIYLRVSTDRQTTESQEIELCEYCKRRGWTNVVEYRDTASGAKFSRDGLNTLMKEVRKGRIDMVVAWKLDRLGRSLPASLEPQREMEAQTPTGFAKIVSDDC